MKKRVMTRIVIAGIIGAMAFIASCAKESKNNNLTTALAAALVTEDARSYDAMPLVPAALASKKGMGTSSTQSIINDAVPQGETANDLAKIFSPVRGSILIGKELVQFGGQLITEVEKLLELYPGLLNNVVAYTDNSDEACPGRIAKLSESTKFTGGRKVEIWWNTTNAEDIRYNQKMLELDYSINSGNIDGVLFFRHLPEERPEKFAIVRVEFRKVVTNAETGAAVRTAYVYVEDYIDFADNDGNAAFFITENENGIVTVEGGYTVTGLKMPFLEANTTSGDWDAGDQRVYLFNGAGSVASGKAVVNMVLPLLSQSAAVDADATPFANARDWSLGELFTDGMLYYMNTNSETYGSFGTHTILWFLNMISGATLDPSSTQEQFINALNSINVEAWGLQAAQVVNDLKIVTGIMNPVYFEKSALGINLVGQLDTDDLDDEAGDYSTLQGALLADFTKFTMEQLFNLDIKVGTSVVLIPDHTGIEAWADMDVTAPAPTM